MNENTDNKARLIENVDLAMKFVSSMVSVTGVADDAAIWKSVSFAQKEEASKALGVLAALRLNIEMFDNIEAAGLLSGSVGADAILRAILDFDGGTIDAEYGGEFCGKLAHTIAILTRSPEPKGRWISEELYRWLESFVMQKGPIGRLEQLRAAPRAKEE